MRINKIMSLEDNSDLDLGVDQLTMHDPEIIIQNDIIATDEASGETEELSLSIEEGEQVNNAITDIATSLLPTIEPEQEGLRPGEASIIEVAVEHFKKKLNYKGSKGIPSLESFGGKMSKKNASKLALEGLTELVSEVNTQLDKSYLLEYSGSIKVLDTLVKSRANLVSLINQQGVTQSEFFTSEKYKPEFVGNDLITGSYTKALFTPSEAIDNKMPVAAFLAGLSGLTTTLSTNAYLPKLQEFTAVLESIVNTELTVESTNESFTKIYDLLINLIANSKVIINSSNTNDSKEIKYPLSSSIIKLDYTNKQTIDKDRYFYAYTDVSKELVSDDAKLCSLSDQEANSVISTINSLVNTTTYIDSLTKCYELVISYLKKFDEYSTKLKVSNSKELYDFDNYKFYMIKNVVNDSLTFYITIAKQEVKLVASILDYTKDSLSYLSSKVVAS